ncbi:MFS transporter [Paracoccus chinensis]|uniref:Predicted arabinose efflux permease, MFS family n=1 Tax=Paracoccus chinensis TaxID=525640 RepID=A0A1G9K010_9RHOB|nr:MFS transporter [Paracoccus chinensis]SDL42826.1 Predicted arabinose efflux permease, MFS family [Paracoccus chinensis]
MTAARRWPVISALGIVQILAWGSSYYLMAVLAQPIVTDTGWPFAWVVAAISVALVCAGLASPLVGRWIARLGGRPVLAVGCTLLTAGLLICAGAPGLPAFYFGWCVIGLGMSAGLYDPAFATLGRLYKDQARSAITALTLWGGFASTVSWPLSTWLLEQFDWRGTVAIWAALHALVSLPLILCMVPREPRVPMKVNQKGQDELRLGGAERWAFLVMAAILVLSGLAVTMISVHLLTFLQAQGISLADAVAIGALLGPTQVAARVVEMAGRGRHHPIWSLLFACGSVAAGLILLALDLQFPALAMILYGAGNGVFSIARGALPLALFHPERYPALMGRLARPALLAQAAAPVLGGAMVGMLGPGAALAIVAALALITFALAALLSQVCSAGFRGAHSSERLFRACRYGIRCEVDERRPRAQSGLAAP